jgi:hypothetical protein
LIIKVAEREGFELVCGIDGVELIDSITRKVITKLSFEGLPVQNRVQGILWGALLP